MPAIIQIEKLVHRFADGTVGLNGVSLEIEEGAFVVIAGANGSGKTTLFRHLNGLLRPTSGSVRVAGVEVAQDLLRARTRVGMIFQRPTPFPLSILDNAAYGLKLYYRLRPSELMERVERALRQAALWDEVKDKLHQPGMALSGGQQQRLCLARCLALEPEVVLMDEPCSSLDPVATAKIEELIHDLRERYTIVIVTHSMQQAARVSDYTAFFYVGELVEYDHADVIFTKPSDPRTEDYITGRFG